MKKHKALIFVTLMFCPLIAFAVDAFFAGRSVRMTKTAAGTCQADGGNSVNCEWFDTSNRERFWNGTASLYTTNSTEGTPSKGKILVGNGTNWQSIAAGTSGQVLTALPTDMGGPAGVVWATP